MTFKLEVKNDAGEQDDGEEITITFPSTLKLSTKGLDQCKATDDAL